MKTRCINYFINSLNNSFSMERKKKILIAIYNLAAGGAQKSLVSLLNTISPEKYSIDLFLLNSQGLFLSQVPEYVNLIKVVQIFL